MNEYPDCCEIVLRVRVGWGGSGMTISSVREQERGRGIVTRNSSCWVQKLNGTQVVFYACAPDHIILQWSISKQVYCANVTVHLTLRRNWACSATGNVGGSWWRSQGWNNKHIVKTPGVLSSGSCDALVYILNINNEFTLTCACIRSCNPSISCCVIEEENASVNNVSVHRTPLPDGWASSVDLESRVTLGR